MNNMKAKFIFYIYINLCWHIVCRKRLNHIYWHLLNRYGNSDIVFYQRTFINQVSMVSLYSVFNNTSSINALDSRCSISSGADIDPSLQVSVHRFTRATVRKYDAKLLIFWHSRYPHAYVLRHAVTFMHMCWHMTLPPCICAHVPHISRFVKSTMQLEIQNQE